MPSHTLERTIRVAVSLVLVLNLLAASAPAQADGNGGARSLRGYSDSNAKTQIEWEDRMRAIPRPELLREYMKQLSAEPHHVDDFTQKTQSTLEDCAGVRGRSAGPGYHRGIFRRR